MSVWVVSDGKCVCGAFMFACVRARACVCVCVCVCFHCTVRCALCPLCVKQRSAAMHGSNASCRGSTRYCSPPHTARYTPQGMSIGTLAHVQPRCVRVEHVPGTPRPRHTSTNTSTSNQHQQPAPATSNQHQRGAQAARGTPRGYQQTGYL